MYVAVVAEFEGPRVESQHEESKRQDSAMVQKLIENVFIIKEELDHYCWNAKGKWKKGGLSSSSTSFVWAAARSNSLSHRQPSLLQQDNVITDNARCRCFDLKSPHLTLKFEWLSKQ